MPEPNDELRMTSDELRMFTHALRARPRREVLCLGTFGARRMSEKPRWRQRQPEIGSGALNHVLHVLPRAQRARDLAILLTRWRPDLTP